MRGELKDLLLLPGTYVQVRRRQIDTQWEGVHVNDERHVHNRTYITYEKAQSTESAPRKETDSARNAPCLRRTCTRYGITSRRGQASSTPSTADTPRMTVLAAVQAPRSENHSRKVPPDSDGHLPVPVCWWNGGRARRLRRRQGRQVPSGGIVVEGGYDLRRAGQGRAWERANNRLKRGAARRWRSYSISVLEFPVAY